MNKINFREIPKILYHYCPLNSFYGIINSNRLHLSSGRYSNDPDESLIGDQILTNIILENKDLEKQAFLDAIKDGNYSFLNENLFKYPLVFCLSEKKDDLNQWRDYGDHSSGFSIGFDSSFFVYKRLYSLLILESFKHPNFEDFYFDHCIYDSMQQIEIINVLVTLFSKFYNDPKFDNQNFVLPTFTMFFNVFSMFFKQTTYKSEEEWRLVFLPLSQQLYNKAKYKLNYKIRKNALVQYIEIPIKLDKENAFKNVDIGYNIANTNQEITDYIYNNGFSPVIVKRSKVKVSPK